MGWKTAAGWAVIALYLIATYGVAHANLNVQSLILTAAVFGILALSLDLVAGMLGLYSLGVSGFFAIGAYVTTIAATDLGINVFILLPVVVALAGLLGIVIGAASLRVSGLYFAITTFIFTLVVTVLAQDLQITNGTQGLLGPSFPDLPEPLQFAGAPIAWLAMLALLLATLAMWNIRRSPLYPVLLSIRDAEPSAAAAGVRTAPLKILIFGASAATAGFAGWIFCFLGVVSPSQFDWAVSLNVLVMVLLGGINTTIGPLIGATFVSVFPVVVNINPWLQEILYGALSILAITVFPEGVVGLTKRWLAPKTATVTGRPATTDLAVVEEGDAAVGMIQPRALDRLLTHTRAVAAHEAAWDDAGEAIVTCNGILFGYGVGPRVLNNINVEVARGHIHGLIGPNGSGKSTLANIIAGRLQPSAGTITIKGQRVERQKPADRARLGLRRTFQAAELVRELTTRDNVLVGAYSLVSGIARRAAIWTLLSSGRRDTKQMQERAENALRSVGARDWGNRHVRDVPHGIEQLTQLAGVCVADPDIIILDEPATGLSSLEVDHLAHVLASLKAKGVTMIIIEHQTRFLFPLCDRVTVLNAGEVILTGTADEVRAHPVVRKVYLGE